MSVSTIAAWSGSAATQRARHPATARAAPSGPGATRRRIRSRSRSRWRACRAARRRSSAVRATASRMPPEAWYPATVSGAPLAAHPGLAQAVREQRQGGRLALDLAQQQVHQPGLDDQPGLAGRSLDRGPEVVLAHRAEQVEAALDEAAERRVRRRGRPSGRPGARRRRRASPGAPRARDDPVQERRARSRVVAEREDLLALVDDEDRATVRRTPAGQRVERVGRPGVMTSTCVTPRGAGVAATPARTSDDFPVPEGPTTARTPVARSRSRQAAMSRSRPKNASASATSYALSPGYGERSDAAAAEAPPAPGPGAGSPARGRRPRGRGRCRARWTSIRRRSCRVRRASPCRPHWYSASASSCQRRSRSGLLAAPGPAPGRAPRGGGRRAATASSQCSSASQPQLLEARRLRCGPAPSPRARRAAGPATGRAPARACTPPARARRA